MKSLVVLLLVAGAATPASADPLWEVQLRAGYGVAVEAVAHMPSTTSTAPMSIEAMVAVAVTEEPPLFAYGGMIAETLRRGDVGAIGGIEYKPAGSALRFTAGGAWIYAPKTMWGATTSAGACTHGKGTQWCADLELRVYVAGTRLEMGHEITQVQLAVGFTFGGKP